MLKSDKLIILNMSHVWSMNGRVHLADLDQKLNITIVVLDHILCVCCIYHIYAPKHFFKNPEPIILLLNCLWIQDRWSHMNLLSNWWEVLLKILFIFVFFFLKIFYWGTYNKVHKSYYTAQILTTEIF